MIKKLLLIFSVGFLINATFVKAFANFSERREQLIEIIDEELKEVIRLNRQIGSKNPNLLLRMAELYLEKARLINEEENYRWLSLSPEESSRANQKDFFKSSRKYFLTAQKTCYYILKRFKRFKGQGEVYYILAYNAKEFQQEKRAKSFFQRAIKYSKRGSYTSIKSKLALGEMYYNDKKYKTAIKYYEPALKKRDQKWWTKDAYNLSWCYFRVGKKSKAISLMNEVHKLSGNSNFVNVSEQVERDLAYFYTESGRTKDAMDFYSKIGKDISSNLLKVGKYLKNNGKFASAQNALVEASRNAKDQNTKNEINIELLSLYDRFGKTTKHLAVSKELYGSFKAGTLNQKQIEDLKYHVARKSAELQKQVVSKTYRKQIKVKRAKAGLATQYFQIQSGLNGDSNHKSLFHAAETQYAVGNFNKAANLYDEAFDIAVLAKDSKIANLSLDGLMASLGGKGVTKATSDKYLSKAYSLYLKKNPRSRKSFKIYQRLFSQNFKEGNIKEAEKVLKEFKFHFPQKIKQQEAMLARIMDFHKDRKDRVEIKKWVDRINTGEFKVSESFAKQLRLILLSMQFDKVQKFNTKGDKVNALKGYLEIYKTPASSDDAKKNAAYNIAILFHELGNTEKAYGWSSRALSLMNGSDVKKFEDSFLLIANGLFNRRKFQMAAQIYEESLSKICRLRAKNKNSFYRNANVLYLAEGNGEKALEVIEQGSKCKVSSTVRQDVELDTLKELADQRRWPTFEKLLTRVKRVQKNIPEVIFSMAQLRDAYFARGRKDKAVSINLEMLRLYQYSKDKGLKIPLEALDVVSENFVEDLRRTAEQLKGIKLSFPENEYNSLLKTKFKYLDQVTSKALDVFKIGSGKGIVEAYSILVNSYQSLGREILSFRPTGKSSEYVASFQNSMKGIGDPLLAKATEFGTEARRQIESAQILSKLNIFFLSGAKLPVTPQYFPIKNGVLMDRGGQK